METVFSMAIGLCFFITCITAYTIGLKHGKAIQNGITPKVNLNPVKAITEAIEQHEQKKEEKETEAQLADVFSYSRESALKAIKSGDA